MTPAVRAVTLTALAGLTLIVLLEIVVFIWDRRWALPVAGTGAALLALELRSRLAFRPPPPPSPADSTLESLHRWRSQAELLISWADGSRADWDRHLRPKLARDFMLASRHKDPVALAAAGQVVFGDLWQWVDPHGARPGGRDEPAPGRDTLDTIFALMDRV